jgi:hypothetical protein
LHLTVGQLVFQPIVHGGLLARFGRDDQVNEPHLPGITVGFVAFQKLERDKG